MRKYYYIFKTELINNLQYVFDTFVNFISYALIIYIYFNLWKYMYDDPTSLINGYNLNQMVWYILVTEILWMCLGGRSLCAAISEDVRGGNITYKINKPYDYVLYCVFKQFGKFMFRFFIYVLLGIGLGYLLLGSIPTLNVIQILLVILSCFMATLISLLIITSIGLISFYIEDANPIYWVYSKIILVIGTLFPIEFFPKILQPILSFSPIYVVSYGPAKLFVNFTYSECIRIFISQFVYIIVCYLLCKFLYGRGVKKINVNGG